MRGRQFFPLEKYEAIWRITKTVRTSTRHLSSSSKTSSIHIQWIPAHINIPGKTLADLEAKVFLFQEDRKDWDGRCNT